MHALQAAVVDLDGTVWRGDTLIEGVREGLDALHEAGLDVVFVTNGTDIRAETFADRLAAVGLSPGLGEVITAGSATAAYVAREYPGARTAVVGPAELRAECRDAGLAVIEEGVADVLVAGRSTDLSHALLDRVLDVVTPGTAFVATNTDPTHPVEDGEEPGAGATVGAIRGMLARDPTVVGKPSTHMADIATGALGVDPGTCLLVGDRLGTDVLMGERAGMETVLVLSGATDRADLAGADVRPDHVVDSLADVGSVLD